MHLVDELVSSGKAEDISHDQYRKGSCVARRSNLAEEGSALLAFGVESW